MDNPTLFSQPISNSANPDYPRETPYSIYISDAPLNLVLSILGRDLGMEFSVDGSQRRRVRDLRLSGSSDQVLAALLNDVGMEAFQFNGQVFVSAADERQVRLVRLDDITGANAMGALADAGLILPEFDIREVAQGKALVMSGPVKYLAISESLIASLATDEPVPEPSVRVRRGGRLEPLAQGTLGSVESAAD